MKNITVKIYHIYLILLISGFLAVSLLPNLLGIKNESFSILFRMIILGLSIFIILSSVFSRTFKPLNLRPFIWFLLFWMLYCFRVFYDLYYDPINLYLGTSASEYAQFAYGVVFIPAFSLLFIFSKNISLNLVLKWIYRIIFFSLILAIIFRFNTGAEGRSVGNIEIGILFFGQYGASLSILSVFFLSRDKISIKSLFYILGFILGFIGIFISASKSPFLALLLVTFIFVIFKYGNLRALVTLGMIGIIF